MGKSNLAEMRTYLKNQCLNHKCEKALLQMVMKNLYETTKDREKVLKEFPFFKEENLHNEIKEYSKKKKQINKRISFLEDAVRSIDKRG